MSDSNWSVRVAALGAVGLLTFVALGTGAFFGALHTPNYGYQSEEAGKRRAQSNQEYPSQIDRDRAGLPYVAERLASGPDPQDSDERQKRDLAAQESMSVWAFWMVIVAGFSALITTLGTGFLAVQVKLTRKAVEDTAKATDAMVEANRISESAQRPFIVIKPKFSGTLEDVAAARKVSFVYENLGKSPARLIRQYYELVPEEHLPDDFRGIDPQINGQYLAEGETVSPSEKSQEFTFAIDVTTMGGPSLSLDFTKPGPDGQGVHHVSTPEYFLGYVIYGDLGGAYWIRRFCFTNDARTLRLIKISPELNSERRCNPDGTLYDGSHHHQG